MGKLTRGAQRTILSRIDRKDEEIWEASVNYLNDRGWNLRWVRQEGGWHLLSWERELIENRQWSEAESFVYGMVFGAVHISLTLMRSFRSRQAEDGSVEQDFVSTASVAELFRGLRRLNSHLYHIEKDMSAIGRSRALYTSFQKGRFDPEYAEKLQRLAVLYEEKLSVEEKLALATADEIANLKDVARNLNTIDLDDQEILPVALAFLTLQLQANWSWYELNGKWLLFAGSKKVFHAENRADFAAFVLGVAYCIASLPDEMLLRISRR